VIIYLRKPPHTAQRRLRGVYAAAYSLLDSADIIDQGVDMIDQGRLVPSFLSHCKTLYAPANFHGAKTSLEF